MKVFKKLKLSHVSDISGTMYTTVIIIYCLLFVTKLINKADLI